MKKNQESDVGKASGVVWKMWLTIEIAVLFPSDRIFYCLWQCFFTSKNQYFGKRGFLQEVFEKLTEQTGYHFVYSNEMLQRTGKVSVDMTKL